MPDDFDPEVEYKRSVFRKLDPRVAQTIFAKPKDNRKLLPARLRKIFTYIWWFCFSLGAVTVISAIVALGTLSLRPHFLNLLQRSWVAFVVSQGATTLGWVSSAIVVPVLTVGVAVIFIRQHRGRDAMLSHWRQDAAITLRVIFFVVLFYYGPLFIWKGLVRTVYDDHQSLAHANTKLKSENGSLAAERDSYKKQADHVPDLEQQIKDLQAKVLLNLADGTQKNKTLEIRNKLGSLIYAAETIKTMCMKSLQYPCIEEKNKWWVKTLTYVSKNLEPSYEARLSAWTEPYLRYQEVWNSGRIDTDEINETVNFLVIKANALSRFVSEFMNK